MRRPGDRRRRLRAGLLSGGLVVAVLWAVCRPSPPVHQTERPQATGVAPDVEPLTRQDESTASSTTPASVDPEGTSPTSISAAGAPKRVPPRLTAPISVGTGESPGARAASAARVRHRVRFRPGNIAWRPIYAAIEWLDAGLDAAGSAPEAVRSGRGGFGVVPLDTRSPHERELRLPLGLPRLESDQLAWEAAEIEWVVVTARLSAPGVASIVFRTRDDELERNRRAEAGEARGPAYPAGSVVSVQVRDTREWQDLVFPVAGNAAWRGTITALRLDLVETRMRFAVDSLRALDREVHAPPSRPGVFFAMCEEALSMELEAQGPATLRFSFGRDPEAPPTDEFVEFEVRVVARSSAPLEATDADAGARFTARIGPDDLGWSAGVLELGAPGAASPGWTVFLTTAGAAAPGEVNGRWADVRVQ